MEAIRLERDAGDIAWLIFDEPQSKVNVLSLAVMRRLETWLDELREQQPAGVVVISGKPGTFIAGADIKELAQIASATQAEAASRLGHRVFGKLEQLGCPSVAAIDGVCLGGGLELALACRYRVVTDNPKTQLGLPETQLGIIPGWGGTQRLPRLVGLRAALDIIVPGKTVEARKALRIGLADAVVPAVQLRETAVGWCGRSAFPGAIGRAAGGPDRARKGAPATRLPVPDWIIRAIARRRTLVRTHGQYPAPVKAIQVAGRGFEAEARGFAEVATTAVCKNLIRVFFLREKYAKLTLPDLPRPATAASIRKVGVLGAGVMGAGIAQWCSSRGLTVRLKDIQPEFVAGGLKRIAETYREGVKRRKLTALEAEHGLARVHPTTDYTGFGDCDLIIEAVLERIDVKRELFRELTPRLRADCVIASNTSAIPIDDLAEVTGRPEHFVGIHFFNPVHKMPLVELVRGARTSAATLVAALEFAKQLKKIPVMVRGTPGFLVNRLLMPYLNEAGRLLGEGVGLTAIDQALLDFGMPMGPLRLIDEVGLDVAVEVANELAAAFPDRMTVAPVIQKLRSAGLKGRKGGKGFYLYERRTEKPNPEVDRGSHSVGAREIQRRLLGVMIAEAKRCLEEHVVESEDDIDVALIFGTGFPPFRGGLVKYAKDTGQW